MALTKSLPLLSLLLLLLLATTTITTTAKQIEVIVEGMVYCQSCEYFGTWSLTDAKPMPMAKVSVICKDHKSRVSYYKVFETDAKGYYHAQLKEFKMTECLLDHPLQSCHVKLVSSPLDNCSLLSNVNYGLNGSPLRYDNKRLLGKNYEAVIYESNPLAFRPNNCSSKVN